MSNFQFYLSFWGALLSSILAIIKIFEVAADRIAKLYVSAIIQKPDYNLTVTIFNNGKRPVNINSIRVRYGDFHNGQGYNGITVYEEQPNGGVKLSEGDSYFSKIDIETIKISTKKYTQNSDYNKRLWIVIDTLPKKYFRSPVLVDPQIIEGDYFKPAEQFIATDILLEFTRKDPIIDGSIILTK